MGLSFSMFSFIQESTLTILVSSNSTVSIFYLVPGLQLSCSKWSSAKPFILILVGMTSTRVEQYVLKSTGPRRLTWGTEKFIIFSIEYWPSTQMFTFLLYKLFWNHFIVVPLTLNCFSKRSIKTLWLTVSKAVLRSSIINTFISFFSILQKMSLHIFNNADSQLCPALYALWCLEFNKYRSKWLAYWSKTHFATNFERIFRMLTGL